MRTDQASRTAEYVAFYRALESARPPGARLFDDPFAAHFLRPKLRRAIALSRTPLLGSLVPWYADRRLPGARTSGVARTLWIDRVVGQSLRQGLGQVVILGAGFDCRAYRLPEGASATILEVDHPATLKRKVACLRRLLPRLPENVRFVPLDFDRQSLGETLGQAGLDRRRPALFVWEGVTNYLTAAAVESVLRFVAGCAPESRIVFTYVDRRALDGSATFAEAAPLLRDVERLGEPWTFGFDPAEIPCELERLGLRLERDAGAREYRAECFGKEAEGMKGYDFYHVVVATVPGSGGRDA